MVAHVAGRATGGDQDRVHAGAGEDAARALARAGTVGLAFLLEPVLHHSDLVLLGDDDALHRRLTCSGSALRSDRLRNVAITAKRTAVAAPKNVYGRPTILIQSSEVIRPLIVVVADVCAQ